MPLSMRTGLHSERGGVKGAPDRDGPPAKARTARNWSVTVSGRPAAVLGPATPTQWRRYADIASVFVGLADARWVADRERLDADAHDRG